MSFAKVQSFCFLSRARMVHERPNSSGSGVLVPFVLVVFFFFYNKKQSGLGRNLWIAELQDVFAHWIHWFAVCLMVVCFSNQDKKKKELRFALIP